MPIDEREDGAIRQNRSVVTWIGGIAGLACGVSLAILMAAALHWLLPGSSAAVFWEIASPLLGILGLIVGVIVFQRTLPDRVWLAWLLLVAAVLLGLFLAFGPVGFPWWSRE